MTTEIVKRERPENAEQWGPSQFREWFKWFVIMGAFNRIQERRIRLLNENLLRSLDDE